MDVEVWLHSFLTSTPSGVEVVIVFTFRRFTIRGAKRRLPHSPSMLYCRDPFSRSVKGNEVTAKLIALRNFFY